MVTIIKIDNQKTGRKKKVHNPHHLRLKREIVSQIICCTSRPYNHSTCYIWSNICIISCVKVRAYMTRSWVGNQRKMVFR